MTLNELINNLIELKNQVGGDATVETINVDENTAHSDDGGGTWTEWGSPDPKIENDVVKLSNWNEYYAT
jgi:hypothetical protein